MTVRDLLAANRSYRRFREEQKMDRDTLVGLVDLTRLCPSAANRQPLRYLLSWESERNARVFAHLRWAAALRDWNGPAPGQRPAAYIVILADTRIWRQYDWDCGIAAQSMLLGAVEQGWGGCMIASIDREGLRAALGIAEHLEIVMVLALGKPDETVVIEDGQLPEPRPYWRDGESVHHVPKRPLSDLLVEPA
jgi:nitroreductase